MDAVGNLFRLVNEVTPCLLPGSYTENERGVFVRWVLFF